MTARKTGWGEDEKSEAAWSEWEINGRTPQTALNGEWAVKGGKCPSIVRGCRRASDFRVIGPSGDGNRYSLANVLSRHLFLMGPLWHLSGRVWELIEIPISTFKIADEGGVMGCRVITAPHGIADGERSKTSRNLMLNYTAHYTPTLNSPFHEGTFCSA